MEWLNKLRKQSIRTAVIWFLVLLILAAAIFFVSGAYGIFGMLSPKTLADLTPETAVGAYVEDDIYILYGDFIEVEEYKNDRPTGKITGRYYLVDFDEIYYMGLSVHTGDLADADMLMDACDDLFAGEIGAEDVIPYALHVKGTIRKMDDEELGYYHSAVDYDSDTIDIMLPYYLDKGRINGLTLPLAIILILGSLALITGGVVLLVKAAKGSYQKDVRKTLEASGSFEAEAEKAGVFFEETQPVCGFKLGRDFLYFKQGMNSILLRPWDVAWAYQSITKHRTNGIPSGKTYAVVIRLMDGRSYTISQPKKKAEQLLQAMEQALPGTVFGYSNELEQVYLNQRGSFAARWEQARPGCINTVTPAAPAAPAAPVAPEASAAPEAPAVDTQSSDEA